MIQKFQAGQIVYLEEGDTRLYAEVIQVVASRQLCWVRPLFLEVKSGNEEPQITGLQEAFDLLWSISLFHPALDVEVISFISQISQEGSKSERSHSMGKQKLNEFIHRVWQSQKNANLSTEK